MMKLRITKQIDQKNVTVITLENGGLQIRLTPGRDGFVLSPGEPVQFRRAAGLAWEVVPSRLQPVVEGDERA